MEKRVFKNTVYEAVAGMTKAFSSPSRLEIIDLLANGEKTVESIAQQTGLSVANASQHLQHLKKGRIVTARREGQFVWYRLNGPGVKTAWKALRDLALASEPSVRATMQAYRASTGAPEAVALQQLPDDSDVVLLDVRPADEFAAGHLPKAVSIPVAELPHKLDTLPADKTIVAYCRGPFCTQADEAVALLRKKGFHALRLEASYLDVLPHATHD
jgi:rhodanese-related sulfurtransferase/DNA-binding transcriptional ArsR family regulator